MAQKGSLEDRMTFALMNLIGREVQVTKTDGCILTGVLVSSAPPITTAAGSPVTDDKSGFILRYVVYISGPKPSFEFGQRDRVGFFWSDVDNVLARQSCGPGGWQSDQATATGGKKRVETDSAISRKGATGAERASLKKAGAEWLEAPIKTGEKLDSGASANGGKWDQFEVNERKFGVKSTFHEDLYTVALDKNSVTAEMEAKANRIAREIESTTSSNAHVLEERGKNTTGAGDGWDDEEAKYGAVVGSGDFVDNKYKPPSKRGASNAGALKPATSPPPTVLGQQQNAKAVSAQQTSWASKVKEGSGKTPVPRGGNGNGNNSGVVVPASKDAEVVAVVAPASKPKPVPAPPGLATPSTTASATSTPMGTPKSKERSREDTIRDFKDFSAKYVSPLAKPSKPKTAPPPMSLDTPPAPSVNVKAEQPVVASAAAPIAASATVVSVAVKEESVEDAAKKAAAKKLNPSAKTFNPSAPAFVPAPPPMMQVPHMMHNIPPMMMQAQPRPRYVPMGPGPMQFQQGQQNFAMYPGMPGMPPMGGYMISVPMPYGATNGGPRMMYAGYPAQPPPPYGLIPVAHYANLPVPPPPMQQMQQMMQMPPPPSSPQRTQPQAPAT